MDLEATKTTPSESRRIALSAKPGDDKKELAWAFLGLNWNEFPSGVWEGWAVPRTLGVILAGLGVYAALAGLLWLAAWQRIQREQPPSG